MTTCTCLTGLLLVVVIHFTKSDVAEEKWHRFCTNGPPKIQNCTVEGKGEIVLENILMESYRIIINTNYDFGIEINVRDFQLENSFLIVQGALEEEWDNQDITNIQFISGRNKSFKFRIPYVKSVFIEICPENSLLPDHVEMDKVTLQFKRTEYEDEDLPLPDDENHKKKKESYEIQFKGKSPDHFAREEFISSFKEIVKKIAYNYSIDEKLNLDFSEPASKMVTIHAIHHCPLEWSDRDNCASVQHSVCAPQISKMGSRTQPDYQLKATHLKKMWMRPVDSYLEKINITIYKLPESEIVAVTWLINTLLPPIILLTLIFTGLKIYNYCRDDIVHKKYIRSNEVKGQKQKKSKLTPNKYQTIPSFITNQGNGQHNDMNDNDSDSKQAEQSYLASILFARHRLMEENVE